ncbi:LysR family transcriptional regulator [Aliagarivorans marinus]|uniref:LysR family transcriptional regulator n=1 Tax=Aliagarivorans marinus TaxID=561965 RepID=UPI0004201AE7|nr:LysR family transcriptional regulator [Aliagarivorans marinus]
MDLNLIRVFVAVYSHCSYTQAANELEISQPAVSQAIKRLEDHLGTALFIREGRGIAPTAKAIQIAQPFENAINLVNTAFASERQLMGYCVEAVLHSIGNMEGIKFALPPSNQKQAFEDLRSNKVDLLLDNAMTNDPAFVVEPLTEQSIVVVCRQGHPRLSGDSICKQAFFAEEHVVLKSKRGGSHFLDILTTESLDPCKESVEVSALSGLAMMVSSTDCIGIMPLPFAQLWADKLGLKIMPMPVKSIPLALHLVYHRRFADDPHHKKIREQLRTRVQLTVAR